MSVLLLCLLAVAAVGAQNQCQIKEAEYKGCVGQATKDLQDFKTDQIRSTRKEELKVARRLCLDNNGCFGDSEELGEGCMEEALKKAQKRLEGCTKTDLTEVIFKDGKKNGKWGKKSGQQLAALEKICLGPNTATRKKNARKAWTCIRKSRSTARKEAAKERKLQRKEAQQLKRSIKQCEAKLGSCKANLKKKDRKTEGTSKLCTCAQSRLANNLALAAEMDSCGALKAAAETGDNAGQTAMESFISKLCLEGRLGNQGSPKGKRG